LIEIQNAIDLLQYEKSEIKSQVIIGLKNELSDDKKNRINTLEATAIETEHLKEYLETFSKLISSFQPDLVAIQSLLEKINSHERCIYLVREKVALVKKLLHSSLLIKDVAGRGKTNTACALATEYGDKLPVVLISAGTVRITDRFALKTYINKTLEQSDERKLLGSDPLGSIIKSVASCAKDLLVIVDAINENADTKILKLSIQEIISHTSDRPVKFIFTCRDIYWHGFLRSKNDFWADCLFDEIALGEFSDEEFEEVLPKYCQHFQIHADLSDEAKRRLKHPLLLRFFCEAHKSDTGFRKLGKVSDIRLKPLFDIYWDKKIIGVREVIEHRDEREVQDFIFSLARKIRFTRDRNLTLADISSITGIQDLSSRGSLYIQLLDARIVIEQTPNESERWKEPRVTFVYDEFMEYAIARELIEKTMVGVDDTLVTVKLNLLSKAAKRFSTLFGVVAYLLPMLEDYFTFDFWGCVYKWGNVWHGILCKALLRSCSQILSLNAVKVAEQLAKKGSVTTKQEMLLLAKELTIEQPEYSIRLYRQLYHDKDREIFSTALFELTKLSGYGYVNAVKVLVAALRHADDRVRESAVYSLADLGLLDRNRIKGLSKDKSGYVREAAVYSAKRFLISDKERAKFLEILSRATRDPVRAVRRAAEESYRSLKLNRSSP